MSFVLWVSRHHTTAPRTARGQRCARRWKLKRSRLAPFSKKRKKSNVDRKVLRYAHLSDSPQCEAGILPGCDYWATDVHEIIGRGVRPGAELEPELYVSLCRRCHSWVTINPEWSRNHGLMLSSWQGVNEIVEAARRVRQGTVYGWCDMDKNCQTNHLEALL